ncbi:hypothetical protein ATANTOWER_007533 [Ataeniobius toweri]|uniref:Uncharacterized protein n=1 Tax=Ataeniobius toweri TaxID=208326 RepID=A0ABU7CF64_9TELE|nr:hypothetical protein [Ataeniobius toweri]
MMQTLDLEVNVNLQPLVCFSSFLNVRKDMVMYFIIQPPHLQKGRTNTCLRAEALVAKTRNPQKKQPEGKPDEQRRGKRLPLVEKKSQCNFSFQKIFDIK